MELSRLINQYICLCEIRGELSPEHNAKLEEQLKILSQKIKKLEASSPQAEEFLGEGSSVY